MASSTATITVQLGKEARQDMADLAEQMDRLSASLAHLFNILGQKEFMKKPKKKARAGTKKPKIKGRRRKDASLYSA